MVREISFSIPYEYFILKVTCLLRLLNIVNGFITELWLRPYVNNDLIVIKNWLSAGYSELKLFKFRGIRKHFDEMIRILGGYLMSYLVSAKFYLDVLHIFYCSISLEFCTRKILSTTLNFLLKWKCTSYDCSSNWWCLCNISDSIDMSFKHVE